MQDTSNVSSQTAKGCKVEGVRQMSLDSSSSLLSLNALISLTRSSGQAVVEFTFTFLILLIVAWIPADFGLAFYSGQLAQNAAREGARIAAADFTLVSGTTSCVMPSCTANIFKETAGRLSSALLPAATITLQLDPDTRYKLQPDGHGHGIWNLQLLFLPAPTLDGGHNKPKQYANNSSNTHEVGGPSGMLTREFEVDRENRRTSP